MSDDFASIIRKPAITKGALDAAIEEWSDFEAYLKQDDRLLFSRMLSESKSYNAAFEGRGAKPADKAEPLLMALVLHQQKMISRLIKRIGYLQEQKKLDE